MKKTKVEKPRASAAERLRKIETELAEAMRTEDAKINALAEARREAWRQWWATVPGDQCCWPVNDWDTEYDNGYKRGNWAKECVYPNADDTLCGQPACWQHEDRSYCAVHQREFEALAAKNEALVAQVEKRMREHKGKKEMR